ncbi:50S ribosomal protein L15 [Candidatus Gracilibacteria bacterium]|nr:50S ribosomal protein L15 [Candidatus Gracilibacteria bacterium]MCF7855981.1 50S ribosomal protein L15 [Candidatus Gracilibacteria bacterium]MCF7896326.1 50S ribosomal protein L15 [Candidatus Gracilibacteria bacterium]
MQQHTLKPVKGSTTRHKRRGIGDTFAGRGCKGQQARVGGRSKFSAAFEGGQISLVRRMPKLGGFRNINRVEFQAVNLGDLEKLGVDKISRETLKQAGLIKKLKQPVKILGFGKLTKKLTCFVDAVSQSAKEAIEKAGGNIELPAKKEKHSQRKEAIGSKKSE